MNYLADIIKKRYKFYIAGYIIAYIVTIVNKGTMNIRVLFPINASSLLLGLLIGTTFYYVSQKNLIFVAAIKGLKYIIFSTILIILLGLIYTYLKNNLNIDISPFIGF